MSKYKVGVMAGYGYVMVMSIACQIARTRNLYQSLISSQPHCDPLSYVTERGGYVTTYVSSPYLAETSYDKHAANVSKLKINYYRYCLAVKDTCGAIWGLLTKIGVGGRQFWEIMWLLHNSFQTQILDWNSLNSP